MRALDNEGEDVVRPPPGSGGGIRKQSVKKGVGGVVVKVWLLLDGSGETPQVIEAGKHAIMRRTGLPARDLRILDPLLSYPSTVLGRERAIVINLEHIKAIITAHEVLLLNSTDPSVTPFVHELHSRILRHHHHHQQQQQEEEDDGMKILPFEFVALEACLEAACRVLDNEAKTLEQEAQPALDKLTSNISTLNLERVRQIKSRLVAITGRVQKIRDELEHLLDDDEDMAEMYLTHKLLLEQTSSTYPSIKDDNDEVNIMDNHQLLHHHHHHRSHPELSSSSYEDHQNNTDINSREESSHHGTRASTTYRAAVTSKQLNVVELEMLLEAYFVQIEGTLNKLSTLREYVDDTEDYINIMLDDKQNHLLQMGVMLSTATAAVTAFIVVMGILGINIHYIKLFDPKVSGMREFIWTVGGCTAGTIFLFVVATAWYKHKRLLE